MTFDLIQTTARYRSIISEILGNLIPTGSEVALFDFPNYSNVGDSMIWLGQQRYLADVAKSRVRAVKDFSHGRPRFPRLDPEVTILLQGGGNTGDLWPQFQEIRNHVIAEYPVNRIIQMPQSIHFEDERRLEEVRRIYSGHSDFHFLARDSKSLTLSERLTDKPGILCPDMALFLSPIKRTTEASEEIIALLREDKEKNLASRSTKDEGDLLAIDWIEEEVTPSMRIAAVIRRIQNKYEVNTRSLFQLKHLLYDRIANTRLRRGVTMLCEGKVVITDRLHAHLLCCLIGIPNVVLDNSYGKIFSLMDTWNTGEGISVKASSLKEAKERARELLDKTG